MAAGADASGAGERDAVVRPSATDAGASLELPALAGTRLLHATFENRSVGPYAASMVAGDFGSSPSWNNGLDEGRATIVEENGSRFLRVTYPAGQFGPKPGGVQFEVQWGGSHDELYLSYRVRFGAGFQFVKGGKLPGMVGGTAPTGCGLDAATVNGGYSARMMWRTRGAVVQLVYTPTMLGTCGDDWAYSVGGTASRFVPDQWHRVVHRQRLNTPGTADGVLEAWFDGELALSRSDVLFRSQGATFHIDTLYFSTFFGGSDATWSPTSDQTVDFDDFMVTSAAEPP